ncbi:MAG: hypothetical protein L0H31_17415 [Nocardioidaceae bacterium]|nr:hypothetical protein [Nocardioidaceae bacterium]
MLSTLGRRLAVGILLAGTCLVSGCGLLNGSSEVEEALEYLPADASTVTFVSRAAVVERLGLEDVDADTSSTDMENYLTTIAEDGAPLTQLDTYVQVMTDRAAFSALDVQWEAAAGADDHRVVVWKLDDDTDFDHIARDLEDAGYQRSGSNDEPTFAADLEDAGADGLIGQRYPASLLNLALVPDEHVVISGDVAVGVAVAIDKADSLSDQGSFDHLLDVAPEQSDLEFAAMTIDPQCGPAGRSGPTVHGDVAHPDGIGFYIAPQAPITIARLFDDEEDRALEAKGFADHLASSGKQTGLDVDFDVSTEEDAVVVETDFDHRAAVTLAWQRNEGPFSCVRPT